MHGRINCWRHKAVLLCTAVDIQKKAKWLQNASTVLCSTDKRFLTKHRLAFHQNVPIIETQKLFWYCIIFSEILVEKNIHTYSLFDKLYIIQKQISFVIFIGIYWKFWGSSCTFLDCVATLPVAINVNINVKYWDCVKSECGLEHVTLGEQL